MSQLFIVLFKHYLLTKTDKNEESNDKIFYRSIYRSS